MSKVGGFDPILKISELEGQLLKANERIKELEYLLDKMNDHNKTGGTTGSAAAEESKKLIEENVKLKAEINKMSATKSKNDKLLFSMGREHAAVASRVQKKAASSVTMKRMQFRANEVKILLEEVVRWLNGLVTLPNPMTTANVMTVLETGSVLCTLIRRIKPAMTTALGKVHEKAPAGSFFAHDNVKAFLTVCTTMGVPAHAIFETNDLVGTPKNVRGVVHCILALAKVAAATCGIAPPDIVRIDMELDELGMCRLSEVCVCV